MVVLLDRGRGVPAGLTEGGPNVKMGVVVEGAVHLLGELNKGVPCTSVDIAGFESSCSDVGAGDWDECPAEGWPNMEGV